MNTVFKSLLFKYKNELYLGFTNENKQLNKFKNILYSDKFDELKENQFCVVLVELINNQISLYALDTVSLMEDDMSQEIIIGEMDNETLFESGNDLLLEHGKVTIH